jgi:uncharacterized protein YbjT (DUF2867 family)
MKIVVVGGTGMIGSKLVDALGGRSLEIEIASPSRGVDTVTGEGLAEALSGAQVVVDVSNSPSFDQDVALAFFATSGRNLLAAEEAAGVEHHVVLSAVGTDRLADSGYFRAKMMQEVIARSANVPCTIVRSTPFFEYINGIVETAAEGDALRISPALIQPIAGDDVALALRDVVLGRAQNRELEIVGPDRFRLDDLARQILAANEDPRPIIADRQALYFGAVLRDDSLIPSGRQRCAQTRFEDWLRLYVAQSLAPAN